MITLGVVLLLIGFLFGVPVLWTIGLVALIIGGILAIAGAAGHAVGPRAHYY